MHLSATRTLFLVLVPILALIVVAAGFAWRYAANERAQQSWVVHTYRVIDRAHSTLGDFDRAEAAQRSYVITGSPVYLEAERTTASQLRADIDALRQSTIDNPLQQSRVAQLQSLAERRLSVLDQGIAAYQVGGFPAAQAVIARGLGLDAVTQAHQTIGDILRDEENLLAKRQAETDATEVKVEIAAGVAAILVLVLALVAGMLLTRGIARLRASEIERTRQAHLLQATLDSIRDGVAAFDRDGKLAAFNPNFFDFGDFPKTLATPGAPLARFNEIDSSREARILGDILRPLEENEGLHASAQHKGRHLECYRNRVPGGGTLVTCVDVSARVQAEEILRQSQKMEAIGQLTGGVAHDFNNLLQVIGTNLELLTPLARGDSKAAARMQNAMFGVERGARLTQQLLAFARRTPLEPRSLNLGRVINAMADLLRRTLGERISIEPVVAGGLWNTLVDPTQFENALLNLAINARDAMPDGGKLTLELANAFLDDAYVRAHREVTSGQYVMVAVTDTGHGMTAEVAARAFDPFFTTKKEGQGTGLGLSQVYGFVKQSGGHIKVYSEPGDGTTVKLYLPRTRQAEDTFELPVHRPLIGGHETIFVVEDDDGVRLSVVDMLIELGYIVHKASNASEALTLLEKSGPVDLLFTDVVMPGPLPTREFVRKAQALHPEMAVLFTSGYTQNAVVHNGRLDADATLLSKPYQKADLAAKLRSMLDAKKAAQAPARTMPKVLAVEDDPMIRMNVVDMLEQLGCAVAEASNGPKALDLLRSDPSISVLLTDVGLPGMGGVELAHEARRLKPGIGVIFSTGLSTYEPAEGVGAIPQALLLAKPFSMDQLKAILDGLPSPGG